MALARRCLTLLREIGTPIHGTVFSSADDCRSHTRVTTAMSRQRDTIWNRRRRRPRRAAVLVLFAALLPVMLGMMAFAIEMGYLVLTRTQLQCAADSAAMAAAAHLADSKKEMYEEASRYAAFYRSGGKPIPLAVNDVEIGVWDAAAREFTPSGSSGNAVRVTARRSKKTGNPLKTLFAGIFGIKTLEDEGVRHRHGKPAGTLPSSSTCPAQ